mgnify:CR=1 FL=1
MPDSVFQAIGQRMNLLGQRQQVLSRNIANADTPGYRPQDIDAPGFGAALERAQPRLHMAAPSGKHIAHDPEKGDAAGRKAKKTYGATPTGNAVVIEEQLVKVAETQSDYQTMTGLYRKHMAMFRIAAGGR